MANNYLEFSEVLPHLTDEEQRWLEHQLETVCVFDGREYAENEVPDDLDPDNAEWRGCRVYRDLDDYDADFGEDAGSQYEFRDEPGDRGRHLWLYAEETACVERVAHLVRRFLAAFRPRQCWSLTYAATCSKPRVGEFGGGGVFVSADDVFWCDAHQFVEQHLAKAAKSGIHDTRRTATGSRDDA